MKKTYINPAMEIVKIETQQHMLTVSMDGEYQSGDPVLAPSLDIPSSVFDI